MPILALLAPITAIAPNLAPNVPTIESNSLIAMNPINLPGMALYASQSILDSDHGEIIAQIRLVANKYELEEWLMLSVAQCESNFRTHIWGDDGRAYGVFQFHQPTFDRYCQGSRYVVEDQIECCAQMISNNLGSHWTCYNYIYD